MNVPENLKYTETHEWVRIEGDTAYVGISDHAQEALGDIVFVEIPEPDEDVKKGEEIATIESVKAASAIYAPLSGTIAETNNELEDTPELINQKPYEAFIFSINMSDPAEADELLSADAYLKFLEQSLEHGENHS
jgi:glycine cleavage system H protein